MSLFQAPISLYFQNPWAMLCLCCQPTGISSTLKTSRVQSVQSELVTIHGCTSREKCEFVPLWVTPAFLPNLAVSFSLQLPTVLLVGHSGISHLKIPTQGFLHTSFIAKVRCSLTIPLIQFNDLITCQICVLSVTCEYTGMHIYVSLKYLCV